MIGHIDRDNTEAKLCNDRKYGMKFKSYKLGVKAGIRAAKTKDLPAEKCPYPIPPDVMKLLQQRARWFAGYEEGWGKIQRKRQQRRLEQEPKRKKKK